MPKLILLYSLVNKLKPHLPAIIAEISFLFENSMEVREKLTTVLKVRRTQTPEQHTTSLQALTVISRQNCEVMVVACIALKFI